MIEKLSPSDREEFDKKNTEKIDLQNLLDLKAVMKTPEGRRFFQWLVMRCGQDATSFTRDSRTYFNEGMRNVALILEGSMKALGLDGVDLLHKAEREYIVFLSAIQRETLIELRGDKK